MKRVCEWCQKEEKILVTKPKRSRVDGGGRKLTDACLEEDILQWLHGRHSRMLTISRKLIIFKAKSLYDEKCGEDNPLKDGFVVSRGWLEKFMKRNNLSCRHKTSIAQKDPVELINKLVSYVVHMR